MVQSGGHPFHVPPAGTVVPIAVAPTKLNAAVTFAKVRITRSSFSEKITRSHPL
jgi:hypothetical protein